MVRMIKMAAVLGAMVGLLLYGAGCKRESKKNTALAMVPKQKLNETASQGIEAFGTVKTKETQDITIDFPARIEQLLVKEGQRVSLGQPLARLDLGDYQAQIRSKEQQLALARFDLHKLEISLRNAKDDYLKARREMAIKENLYQEGVIARQEMEDYRDVLKLKEKAVTDLQLSLDDTAPDKSGGTMISLKQQEITNLMAEIIQLRHKLQQNFIRQNVIVSLMNGVVYELGYAAGDPVTDEKKVLGIMRLDGLIVDADVSEEFIKDVRIGAPALIVPVADNSRKYRGKVTKIAGMATKQNGETTVTVEIALIQPDGFLQPNYNVDVTIIK